MKKLMIGMTLSVAIAVVMTVAGCADKGAATGKPAGDLAAGKTIAERDCKGCHGVDGKGLAPGIPNLANQRQGYLMASLMEYKDGKRNHAALKELATRMSEADMQNVSGYFASLPAVPNSVAVDVKHSSPYEQGKVLAEACAKCHGEDGNSKAAGTPSLAGQQPHYLVAAIQEYHQGERKATMMKSMLRDSDKLEIEHLALYFSAQTPTKRGASARGDAAAGEPLTAMCSGCHGARGVSADSHTPSLAGQDAQYLAGAVKAYRKTRQNWGMQRYVAGLSDQDIDHIVAYYASQDPQPAGSVATSTQELADKCNRCHDTEDATASKAPKMRGQDKDYLVMALRAYRDDKRESSTMHRMSVAYSNAMIESLAAWYASQPAK